MQKNLLVTGPPGSGKTTLLLKLCKMLNSKGVSVGGVICPEIREGRTRVGFEIVDLMGRRGTLAHVSLYSSSPVTVSRYGVNLHDLDQIAREALSRHADVFIVDEIGPMELRSRVFAQAVEKILSLDTPVVAAIHYRTSSGFTAKVKGRCDTRITVITPELRDELPGLMSDQILGILGRS
jgi:nucleoside-triphosphatase